MNGSIMDVNHINAQKQGGVPGTHLIAQQYVLALILI